MLASSCSAGSCSWTTATLANGSYTYSVRAVATETGEASSVTFEITDTTPGAPRNIAGEQHEEHNWAMITWDAPLRDGSRDASVTHYTATRELYNTQRIAASSCGTTSPECTATFQGLTYDTHNVVVTAHNSAGSSGTVSAAVTMTDTSTTTNTPTTPTPTTTPFTATASGVPAHHTGRREFDFRLTFSEETDLSHRTLRDHAF